MAGTGSGGVAPARLFIWDTPAGRAVVTRVPSRTRAFEVSTLGGDEALPVLGHGHGRIGSALSPGRQAVGRDGAVVLGAVQPVHQHPRLTGHPHRRPPPGRPRRRTRSRRRPRRPDCRPTPRRSPPPRGRRPARRPRSGRCPRRAGCRRARFRPTRRSPPRRPRWPRPARRRPCPRRRPTTTALSGAASSDQFPPTQYAARTSSPAPSATVKARYALPRLLICSDGLPALAAMQTRRREGSRALAGSLDHVELAAVDESDQQDAAVAGGDHRLR